ncbi:MAG: DUF504 domain-containing protein [Thermoplasmata archaeon]|nr:MAG: DUF504 domain-containing protein [Thermoplasmata archaeon]
MIKLSSVRDILNELKWRDEYDFEKVVIFYLHRGAPGDFKELKGSEIAKIGRSFITTKEDTMIPYHRVLKIIYDDKTLFER